MRPFSQEASVSRTAARFRCRVFSFFGFSHRYLLLLAPQFVGHGVFRN